MRNPRKIREEKIADMKEKKQIINEYLYQEKEEKNGEMDKNLRECG